MGNAIEKLGIVAFLLMLTFVAVGIGWVLFYLYLTTTPALFG